MIKVTSREDFLIELQNLLAPNPCSAELGVYRGEFAAMVWNYLHPSILILIDPFEENNEWYGEEGKSLRTAYSTNRDLELVREKFSTQIADGRVVVGKNYSYFAVHLFEDGWFNFIYIDASHRYDDVKRDLSDWLPKLSINGLMCGHDYIDANNFGVVKAVDEFMKEQGFEMALYNETEGDFALKRKQ